MIDVRVQAEPFDAGAALARLGALGGGAVASFTGIVRDDGGLAELFLEHHPAMTQPALLALAEAAVARWWLLGATIVHRVGALVPGDPIVLVATAAPHREDSLDACAALIDRLKTDAPFWKRERLRDGTTRWIEPRAGDAAAASRWAAALATGDPT